MSRMASLVITITLFFLANVSVAQAIEKYPQVKRVITDVEIIQKPEQVISSLDSIKTEIYEWLEQSGLQLITPTRPSSKEVYKLSIKIYIQRYESEKYWHAVSIECFRDSTNDPQSGTVKNEVINNSKKWHSAHMLAQKGIAQLHDNIFATIQRCVSEIYGNSLKWNHSKNSVWFQFNAHSSNDLAGPFVINYNPSPLEIRKQPTPPAYPSIAKNKGVQGSVVVGIFVDTKGLPIIVEPLSGPDELIETAVNYALEWEFKPATLNDQPINSSFKLTMPFRLK